MIFRVIMSLVTRSGNNEEAVGKSNVVRSGYLKKLKTSKKKFFVLKSDTPEASASLEYYDNEKKYNTGQRAKRVIPLKNCFNINRRLDIKNKAVVTLFTKDDNFGVVFDTEEDANSWLRLLIALQHGEEFADTAGPPPKPTFEHVWHVQILSRGLGGGIGLQGYYHLCLTDKSLSLIKIEDESKNEVRNDGKCEIKNDKVIELNLTNIRSCGFLRNYLYLEIGRSSALGAGELWMETEDFNIAENIHVTVYHAMSNSNKDDVGPKTRNRSSSATESSRPTVLGRTQTVSTGATPRSHLLSQDTPQTTETQVPSSCSSQHPFGVAGARERCDSMPSRARTTSEGAAIPGWTQNRSHLNPHRPSSLYSREVSHSPPSSSPVSPPSAGCSTDSAGSSYSLVDETDGGEADTTIGRYSHSLTPDEAIAEEECPESPTNMAYFHVSPNYVPMNAHGSDDGYVDMSPRGHHHNNSPAASLSSVTSGTPSTDMRFAEYHLQKVSSYFSTSDEADDARPARAYSVGSRPNKKDGIEVPTNENDKIRTRALSVGSKAKKPPSRVLQHHGHHVHSNKSSSAPLLSNTRSQGSHNSIGPMDDLMEMDFSRSGSINSSDYMDMTPPNSRSTYGYVEMKPIIPEKSRNETSPYVDMTCGSSPAKSSFSEHSVNESVKSASHDYVNMDAGKNVNNNNNNSDYIDMSAKSKAIIGGYQLSPVRSSFLQGSPSNDDSSRKPRNDGYVEMNLGKGHHRQSSLDSAQIVNEDYTNMSLPNKKDKNVRKRKNATRSQPIAIQHPSGSTQKHTGGSGSGSPIFILPGRKHSTGTSPMHLPLVNVYSSLPRQRTRKDSRRDSKDSSSSSVTTPSSSSTIFPISLNSPCSPIKTETAPVAIKVPPTILNISYKRSPKTDNSDDYLPMNFEKNKSPSSNQSDYVNYNPASPKTPESGDYAVMDLSSRLKSSTSPLVSRMTTMSLSDKTSFRPINEDKPDQTPDPPYEVLRTNSIQQSGSRPSSATDTGARSRPGSTSSELCSSGSTIVGSRPESVNSDRVRPPSVTSADVQLYYASLDLDDGNRSPRTVKSGSVSGVSESQGQNEPILTYASIDFIKSEELKNNTSSKVNTNLTRD